jgi:hypothetical protein
MRDLGYPERHHLNAALGWLELGNLADAKAEADCISWLNRVHPEVFQVRWRIHAGMKNWAAARDLSRLFARVCPERPTGWLCLSYSLFRLQRPLDAFLHLLHHAEVFPGVRAIPYFLACYCWEMGDFQGAGKWLAKFRAHSRSHTVGSGTFDHTQLLMSCEGVLSAAAPDSGAAPKPSARRQPLALG